LEDQKSSNQNTSSLLSVIVVAASWRLRWSNTAIYVHSSHTIQPKMQKKKTNTNTNKNEGSALLIKLDDTPHVVAGWLTLYVETYPGKENII
jgi:precorrin-6B methylase 1